MTYTPHPTPHSLTFRFPVPGAYPDGDVWRLNWAGCAVMGILNVTPDSFSDGGRYADPDAALLRAGELLEAGALILDVGGESTRPGAEDVPEEVELGRVLPVVTALAQSGRAVISVDTRKPGVARAALAAGAHLINDVSGLRDADMLAACAEFGAPAAIMHMRGEPQTMQRAPVYGDVVDEVFGFLKEQAERALAAGLPSVLLDPGLGFGKTLAHNLALLRALPQLCKVGHPVLVGASRKQMIDRLAGVPLAQDRDPGSIALHLRAASWGAALARVHDVAGHVQALRVWQALEPL